MNIDLNEIWAADGMPKSAGEVEDVFDPYLSQLREQLQRLLAQKSDDKPGVAASLVAEVQQVLSKVRTHTATATKRGSPEDARIADQLRKFAEKLNSWCSVIVTASGDAATNTRSRFADAGAWATHYSTVRMTITTFFVTTTWAIISLKWDAYSRDLWWAALIVWIFAGAFLLVFTGLTQHASSQQQEYKSYLPALDGRAPPKRLKRSVKFWIWAPVILYAFASGGFGWLLYAWIDRAPKTAITWAALVNESSLKKQEDAAGLQSVRLSDWGAKIDALGCSVDQIRLKLSQPAPTITPNPTPTATPKPSVHRRHGHRKGRRSHE